MQFIKRSACPQLLADNQSEWTMPWVVFYRIGVEKVPPKLPSVAHWRKPEIRIVLINDFHNNCGFCGESIPTPLLEDTEAQNTERVGIGDVEHLKPKSKYPELVYEWANYLWSCKPCNFQKKEFFDKNHPFLNPCCEEDCENLEFIEDTGRYELKDTVVDDYWKQRLRNTELKTMLNADELCRKRKFKIGSLRKKFESIERFLLLLSNGINLSNIFQKQIDDSCAEILAIMASPDFHLLLQDSYQSFCQEYPLVKNCLRNYCHQQCKTDTPMTI